MDWNMIATNEPIGKDSTGYWHRRAAQEVPHLVFHEFEFRGNKYTFQYAHETENIYDEVGDLVMAIPKDIPSNAARGFLAWAIRTKQQEMNDGT